MHTKSTPLCLILCGGSGVHDLCVMLGASMMSTCLHQLMLGSKRTDVVVNYSYLRRMKELSKLKSAQVEDEE